MPDTIPARQDDLLTFLEDVDAKLTATPAAFGIDAPAAQAFNALLVSAKGALLAAETARNDAKAKTVALDLALDAILQSFRALANMARANPELTDEDLATINVFRRSGPSRLAAPSFAPVLALESLNVGSAVLSARQPGGSRSRPPQASHYELSLVPATAPPVEGEANSGVKRFVSTSRMTVATDIGAPRLRVYARYVTPRAEVSPWSLAVEFNPQN